ncbi:YALIA101S07e03950g1_1 [Yarrowia lipolytica]|nr:YALIA101S07e03950g1_1 [Yarrowia lipolytica]
MHNTNLKYFTSPLNSTTLASSAMLYHSTLRSSSPKSAICGRFSGKSQQVITLSSTGNALYLYSHDGDTGTVTLIHTHLTHCQVREIRAFRLPGLKKDYVIASSDSGVISVLEFRHNRFVSLHKEAYGRSGIRRVVPGEFLAVDPKGRACMLASVEKSKLVYVLNRQGADIVISSPLEAHTSCVTYFVVACDVAYENPVFAAIETPVGETSPGKQLVFYELDLGLNHVIRKAPVDIPNSTSHVTAVPGGTDGPGGVLVFSTNAIVHHVAGAAGGASTGAAGSTKIALPKPAAGYDNVIVASALHQSRDLFFYIAQNTRGDLFKISRDSETQHWSVLYFGTMSCVCTSLTILKSAHMVCLSEQGDSHMMFFESLGDDDAPENVYDVISPSPYLTVTQTLFELKPVFDSVVGVNTTSSDHVGPVPNVLSLISATRGGLKLISHALKPSIIVASPLPEPPSKLWTMRDGAGSDKYIVLSYANATLVLEIGDSVVETTSSGLTLDKPTLHCGSVGSSYVQVMTDGMNVIPMSREGSSESLPATKWTAPSGQVICASSSSHQVVLGLTSSLFYFEDTPGSELSAYDGAYELSSPPTAVAVAPVPAGRVRSPFVAVATDDETVRIVSVDPESMFETVAVQGLMATASSLALLSVGQVLYLHMGLANGVYVRVELDPLTGEIVGSWSKFVGLGRLSVVPVTCGGEESILVSSRGVKTCLGHVNATSDTWVPTGGNSAPFFALDAISGEPLDLAHSFHTQDCPHGVIGVAGSTLKIFTVNTAQKWTENEVKLEGTAKRLIQHDATTLTITQNPDRLVSVDNGAVGITKDLGGPPTSICEVMFGDGKRYFAVGGSRDGSPGTSGTSGYISIFSSSSLGHVHTTEVEAPPLALCAYNGLLVAGIGSQVRLYALGLKQVLRKAQIELSKRVTCLAHFAGSNRVAVGDIRQSVTVCVVLEEDSGHVIYPLVCDKISRQVTCLFFVDYETVALGDRFGGFTMLRIPSEASKLADEDHNAVHLRQLEPTLNGPAHFRFDHVASFHIEDVPVAIHMYNDYLVVCGLLGTVSAFVPVVSPKQSRDLKTIEKFVCASDPGLMGRDHGRFRGYYVPVKEVVDGDMLREVLVMDEKRREEVGEKTGLGVEGAVGRVVNVMKGV